MAYNINIKKGSLWRAQTVTEPRLETVVHCSIATKSVIDCLYKVLVKNFVKLLYIPYFLKSEIILLPIFHLS